MAEMRAHNLTAPPSANPPAVASEAVEPHLSHPGHRYTQAVLMAHTAEPRALKYPKKAVARRVEGTVLLRVGIGPKGSVTNVSTISGDPILAESSIREVRKWRFFPATRDGSPVDDQAEIQFGFRLKGNQIRSEVLGDFPFVPKSTY